MDAREFMYDNFMQSEAWIPERFTSQAQVVLTITLRKVERWPADLIWLYLKRRKQVTTTWPVCLDSILGSRTSNWAAGADMLGNRSGNIATAIYWKNKPICLDDITHEKTNNFIETLYKTFKPS